jgi:hypothetical protein
VHNAAEVSSFAVPAITLRVYNSEGLAVDENAAAGKKGSSVRTAFER